MDEFKYNVMECEDFGYPRFIYANDLDYWTYASYARRSGRFQPVVIIGTTILFLN